MAASLTGRIMPSFRIALAMEKKGNESEEVFKWIEVVN